MSDALAPDVLIPVYARASGLSAKAIRRKIEEGVWLEKREYHRAADGHIYISVEGASRWVRTSKSANEVSASPSPLKAAAAGRR